MPSFCYLTKEGKLSCNAIVADGKPRLRANGEAFEIDLPAEMVEEILALIKKSAANQAHALL